MTNRTLFYIAAAAAAIIIVFFSIGVYDAALFRNNSQWADFVGGTLGPILTFFGFIGLLHTIQIQRDELSLTREELQRSATALESQSNELKKQSFENTFFKMLEFHASIVSSLYVNDITGKFHGRDCFSFFYFELRNKMSHASLIDGNLPPNFQGLYNEYWYNIGRLLGHYYRYLYNFVKFADSNNINTTMYLKMIRAQFTDEELILLYYNTRSDVGRNFLPYLEKHNFFEKLRKDLLIIR